MCLLHFGEQCNQALQGECDLFSTSSFFSHPRLAARKKMETMDGSTIRNGLHMQKNDALRFQPLPWETAISMGGCPRIPPPLFAPIPSLPELQVSTMVNDPLQKPSAVKEADAEPAWVSKRKN